MIVQVTKSNSAKVNVKQLIKEIQAILNLLYLGTKYITYCTELYSTGPHQYLVVVLDMYIIMDAIHFDK